MKRIYITDVYDDKIEFLQGDSRTSTTTFHFDNDIKYRCYNILSKLNNLHSGLEYVNIYYINYKIYVVG